MKDIFIQIISKIFFYYNFFSLTKGCITFQLDLNHIILNLYSVVAILHLWSAQNKNFVHGHLCTVSEKVFNLIPLRSYDKLCTTIAVILDFSSKIIKTHEFYTLKHILLFKKNFYRRPSMEYFQTVHWFHRR